MTGPDHQPTIRPPDAVVAPAVSTQSVSELVSSILKDVQLLARQQVDMLKVEVREDINRTKQATVYGGLGIACLSVGGIALVFGIVHLINWLNPELPLWASWMIFAALFLVGGFVLGTIGKNLFESFNPLPDKTYNALQENLTWKTQPQT